MADDYRLFIEDANRIWAHNPLGQRALRIIKAIEEELADYKKDAKHTVDIIHDAVVKVSLEKDQEYQSLLEHHEVQTKELQEERDRLRADYARTINERDAAYFEVEKLKSELAERDREIERLRGVLTDVAHCGNYEASQRAIDALKEV